MNLVISSQVAQLPEDQYLGYFIGGLRPEIRLRVRMFNPINRIQAMRIVRDVKTGCEARWASEHRNEWNQNVERKQGV